MKRIQSNYVYPSEFASDFPDYFPQSYGGLQQSASTTAHNHQSSSIGNDSCPSNSSSSIISRIGSPASAFYATELYMGLSQYDFQENSSNCSSRQSKNSYPRTSSSQQSGNGFFGESTVGNEAHFQPQNSQYIRNEGGSYRNPFSLNISESDQILHLKNKLLGDFDDSNRTSPSVPLDPHQDLQVSITRIHFISHLYDLFHTNSMIFQKQVSHNLYAPHLAQMKQFSRPPGCLSITTSNSLGSPAPVSSSKARIRWTQDLHDRFVECVNRLGGPDSKNSFQ